MISEKIYTGEYYEHYGSPWYRPKYDITVKCTQAFSCHNSTDYSVEWSRQSANLAFYWESESLEDALIKQAYKYWDEEEDKYIYDASTSFNRIVDTGAPTSPTINPGQTNNIYNNITQGTAVINKESRRMWDSEGSGEADNITIRGQILNDLSGISNAALPHINIDKEAVLMEDSIFKLKNTFLPGEGGLIGGAKRWLIHPRYCWRHGEWGWDRDNYMGDEIGFSTCDSLAFSSFTSPWASPTEGIILRPEDDLFTDTLGIVYEREASIMLYNGCPLGARHWKFYCPSDGTVYPIPYPRN